MRLRQARGALAGAVLQREGSGSEFETSERGGGGDGDDGGDGGVRRLGPGEIEALVQALEGLSAEVSAARLT